MRVVFTASLVMLSLCATPALTFGECREDARAVVEHARKRGYRFELTLASAEGTCWIDSSGYLLFASATSTSDVVCDGRLFAKAVVPDPPAASATVAAPDTPEVSVALRETEAAAAPWTIQWIRIATPDGGSIFPTEDTSDHRRGWMFRITAPRDDTFQYRIDTVEFKTQEECTQWRNAF